MSLKSRNRNLFRRFECIADYPLRLYDVSQHLANLALMALEYGYLNFGFRETVQTLQSSFSADY